MKSVAHDALQGFATGRIKRLEVRIQETFRMRENFCGPKCVRRWSDFLHHTTPHHSGKGSLLGM